jgi:hypothetical protein
MDLIQVGVSVTGSRKKESSESVPRRARPSPPHQAGPTFSSQVVDCCAWNQLRDIPCHVADSVFDNCSFFSASWKLVSLALFGRSRDSELKQDRCYRVVRRAGIQGSFYGMCCAVAEVFL